jgi:hypothetical protein
MMKQTVSRTAPLEGTPEAVDAALAQLGCRWWVRLGGLSRLQVQFTTLTATKASSLSGFVMALSPVSFTPLLDGSLVVSLETFPPRVQHLRPTDEDHVRLLAASVWPSDHAVSTSLDYSPQLARAVLARAGFADWYPTPVQLTQAVASGGAIDVARPSFARHAIPSSLEMAAELAAVGFDDLPESVRELAAGLAAAWDGSLDALFDAAACLDEGDVR